MRRCVARLKSRNLKHSSHYSIPAGRSQIGRAAIRLQAAAIVLSFVANLCGCGSKAVDLAESRDATAAADARHNDSNVLVEAVEPATAAHDVRSDDWFEDVTGQTGIRFAYRNGREAGRFYFIESFGGGVALVDFDSDGDSDLFFTAGGAISADVPGRIDGLPSALFRNDGDWQFVDVTARGGFSQPPEYSQGCAVTDYNVDGFPDLFVCCYGRSRLYCNQGDGTYAELSDKGALPAGGWGTAAAFGDFDRDGFPDLLLARYTDWSPERDVECYSPQGIRDLCGPTAYSGTTCQFFHNSGDGSFENWSAKVGIESSVRGLGVIAADLNGDGWLDFYVASDETPKPLYLGGPDLRFVENGAASGVALGEWGQPEGSMGVDVGDFDGDGRPDIWVTNFDNEDNSLFRNVGEGLFMHATVAAGLAGVSRMNSGFGTALADFDGDGWLDIFVFNGNPTYRIAQSPFLQDPQLFHNLQGRRFENVSARGGSFFREKHAGRGSAVGDLDGDGAADLVAVPMNSPVRLLRNRQSPKNFVSIALRARKGEPDATGAQVAATYDGRRVARFAVRGGGYFSHSDPRMIFPVAADAATVDVTVDWPGRGHENFQRLAVRKTHLLIEGRGAAINEPQ